MGANIYIEGVTYGIKSTVGSVCIKLEVSLDCILNYFLCTIASTITRADKHSLAHALFPASTKLVHALRPGSAARLCGQALRPGSAARLCGQALPDLVLAFCQPMCKIGFQSLVYALFSAPEELVHTLRPGSAARLCLIWFLPSVGLFVRASNLWFMLCSQRLKSLFMLCGQVFPDLILAFG